MVLHPRSLDELSKALAAAHAAGEKISGLHLETLNRLLDHTPEDMTATVEAGLSLQQLQSRLAERNQWLPIDPPLAESLTVGDLLAWNRNGPRRFGYGTIRDHLIGMKAVLADGRIIKAGGKVVKNVAGYDMAKLFVGSRHSLGIIIEATFKLQPIPETEGFVESNFESLDQADRFIETVLDSELTPVVLDLHNLSATEVSPSFVVVLGFSGPREDVEIQLSQASLLGANRPSNLDHEQKFWSISGSGLPRQLSVLPSKMIETIRQLGPVRFAARAGNGVIWYRGESEVPPTPLPIDLLQRLKQTFDPKRILPDLSL